jgi:DMSO/TMAO reductase YedYZ molybdopterin-dependent catalytic subunit
MTDGTKESPSPATSLSAPTSVKTRTTPTLGRADDSRVTRALTRDRNARFLPSYPMPESTHPATSMQRLGRFLRHSGDVQSNRALTSIFGIALLVLLTVQILSALGFALLSYNVAGPTIFDIVRPVHFFVGFLLFPLIGIKLASVGYRMARYYTRNDAYRAAGPPKPLLRLIAPLLVLSMVVLFASGVEMWSFQNQFGWTWITIHDLSAFTFVAVLTVHVAYHVRSAARSAKAELRRHAAGAITRRALLAGGTVAGLTLAVGAAQWPSSALSFLAPKRAADGALDFPVMNYEGGGQLVDVARWRLAVSGAVSRPLTLTLDDIMAMPMEEHRYSIDCVTGWTATRTWRGVPVRHVLALAGVHGDAGHVQVRSTSGYHWDHSLESLRQDGALLVTHVDGVVLNDKHGYPLRLMIPGVTGQSNIKWVDGLIIGTGAPENYLGAHTQWGSQPVSGYFLPSDPVAVPK